MSKTLQKNLRWIRSCHPALYPDLHPFAQTEPQDARNDSSPDHAFVQSQREPEQTRAAESADFYYALGTGNGNWVQLSIPVITQSNRGVCLIEPDSEAFIAFLCQHDLSVLLQNRRVFWVVGRQWKSQLQAVWEQTRCYAAGQPVYVRLGADHAELELFIRENIHIQKQALKEKIDCLPDTLRNVPPFPLRIWCFEDLRGKQKYSIIQHALIRTLFYHWQQLGCEVEYTRLIDGEYYPPFYRIITLAEFQPNLIFLCNKSPAYEFALGAELSRSLAVPKIVWHADDPIYGEHLLQRYGITADESHWVADYGWASLLKRYGAETVHYLPGAGTRSRRGKRRVKRQCEVVFVGQVRHQTDFFNALPREWRNHAEKIIAEKLRFPRKDLQEVLRQFPLPGKMSMDVWDELKQKILWEANTRFRLQILSGLKDFDLNIYGNEDWLKWLPDAVAKRCFRGVLHYKRLFEVYRNACIALNIHSLQTYTCMNVRDFDVPVAGGFLVSDWLPRAEEIYQPGFVSDLPLNNSAAEKSSSPQVFFYRSVEELQHITAYFISHPEQRLACIERARQHVLENHTYRHRAHTLKVYMENRLQGVSTG